MSTAPADMKALPDGLGIEDLRALMQSVTETTERLQSTHTTLHEQVARLQRELAEANSQLRRSKQLAALGEMAAGIAHELRNPLGSIQLYVQMLEEDLAGNEAHTDLCRKISRAVSGLDAIVRDVLQFARDTVVRPEPVRPDTLFDDAVDNCRSLIAERDVRIDRRFNEQLNLHGDASLLAQALTNLIRNAVEAMHEAKATAPVLTLETSRQVVRCPSGDREPRMVLAVQDNGAGVTDDVLQRMFNPFFTTRATGTGLGLAIVHRIVDAHGGHINVRNMPGGGARFELLLPQRPSVDETTLGDRCEIEIKTIGQAPALQAGAGENCRASNHSTSGDSR